MGGVFLVKSVEASGLGRSGLDLRFEADLGSQPRPLRRWGGLQGRSYCSPRTALPPLTRDEVGPLDNVMVSVGVSIRRTCSPRISCIRSDLRNWRPPPASRKSYIWQLVNISAEEIFSQKWFPRTKQCTLPLNQWISQYLSTNFQSKPNH